MKIFIFSGILLEGVIFDIKKYAIHDGPGIRTTVFFKGCPLGCLWCHNPESREVEPERLRVKRRISGSDFLEHEEVIGKKISVPQLLAEIEKDLLFYEESGGGVTFSGGEPFLQVDFLREILAQCKVKQINTAVDTSGYTSFSKIRKVIEFTDLFLFDLKLIDNEQHKRYTGVSNEIILKNLIDLSKLTSKIRVRIPLIPDITDTEKNLHDIIDILKNLKNRPNVDLLPYNEICEGKYERFNKVYELDKKQTQSKDKLSEIGSIFEKDGFEIKFKG